MNIKGEWGVEREMVENHKVDRGEGEGRRENLGERRRLKKRDNNMENGKLELRGKQTTNKVKMERGKGKK